MFVNDTRDNIMFEDFSNYLTSYSLRCIVIVEHVIHVDILYLKECVFHYLLHMAHYVSDGVIIKHQIKVITVRLIRNHKFDTRYFASRIFVIR